MRSLSLKTLTALSASIIALTACQAISPDTQQDSSQIEQNIPADTAQADKFFEETIIFDFENDNAANAVNTTNVEKSIINHEGSKALKVHFQAKDNFDTGFKIEAPDGWDWSQDGTFGIAMDIVNPGDHDAQVFLNIADKTGKSFQRSVAIPRGGVQTYYAELQGDDVASMTGLRDNPEAWDWDATKFIWMWGTKQLDVSQIASLGLSMRSKKFDRELVIDNIRIVSNPKTDPNYLKGIVDKYGQNPKVDFPLKIQDDAEFKAVHEAEMEALKEGKMDDRAKFGGWLEGPKLEGTGYFRTEKVGDTWAIVDPEGYLFYSNGIANVRMSNISTFTGMDFTSEYLNKERSSDELTPEDSLGLNRVQDSALPGRYVASEVRRDMFTWLPDYDSELGDHYGYRRSAMEGYSAVPHGETYAFYSANLERKYGESSPRSYMDDWENTTINRMLNWGFTSFGNWVDPQFYDNGRYPYFANGWIIGDFKTVSSGDDFWAPLPDPFDPVFAERTEATVSQVAKEVQNSPWCVGIFIDNEKSWGRMGTIEGQYGIVINTLGRDGADSPTKAEFTRLMKEKHGSIEALNTAWESDIASWEAFDAGVNLKDHTAGKLEDYALLLEAYASEYFRIVHNTVEKHLPNHMYMGARFASWGMTPEIRAAAKKYADIMSYNIYEEQAHPKKWAFLEELDMPSIIGEFHMGAMDSGLFHPGLIHAVGQKGRGEMYKEYMDVILNNKYFVGSHWFQYIDSPNTGRAYDGENYNVGFVNVTDTPYTPLIEAAKEVNRSLYDTKFVDLKDE